MKMTKYTFKLGGILFFAFGIVVFVCSGVVAIYIPLATLNQMQNGTAVPNSELIKESAFDKLPAHKQEALQQRAAELSVPEAKLQGATVFTVPAQN